MSISSISSLNLSSLTSVNSENSYANLQSSVDISALTADSVELSEGSAVNSAADKSAPQDINELYNRKSQAQGELGELKNKVDDNQTKLNDRREELSKANKDENGSKETDENYEAAKQELAAAKTAKSAAQNELTRANQEGTANDKAISSNNQAKTANAANLSSAQAELASLQPPAEPKEGEDNSAAVSAYQQKKAALEAKISQLNAEKARLESESQQLQAKKSQIEQTKSAKQSEVSKQEAAMQAAQHKMDSAKSQEADNNPKFKEALQNDEQTETVQKELDDSKVAVTGKEQEIQQLDAQIAKLEASNNDYAKTEPNVSNMLSQMDGMVGLSGNKPEDAARINELTKRTGIDCQTTPWCAAYAMNEMAENGVLDISTCPNSNFCPTVEKWGNDQNIFEKQGEGYMPRPGDGVLFDWEQDGVPDHMGVIEKIENGKIYTIEGNSHAIGGDGSENAVARREYSLDSELVRGYLNCSKQRAQIENGNAPIGNSGEINRAAELNAALDAEEYVMEAAGEESSAGEVSAASDDLVDYEGQKVPRQVKEMLEHMGSMEGLSEHDREDAQKINEITGRNGIDCRESAWCCAFATAMMQEHGVYDSSDLSWTNHIRCGEMMHVAEQEGTLELSQAHGGDYVPHPGDPIFFSWDGKAWEGQAADGGYYEDHIGIVEKVEDGKIYTIEGNSGDAVSRKCYDADDPRISGFMDVSKTNGLNYGDEAPAAAAAGEAASAGEESAVGETAAAEEESAAGEVGDAAGLADYKGQKVPPQVKEMFEHLDKLEGLNAGNWEDAQTINEITGKNWESIDCQTNDWCCAFATAILQEHGVYDSSDLSWTNHIRCGEMMHEAQKDGCLEFSEAHGGDYVPHPGDAIFFSWDGKAWEGERADGSYYEDHIGIVEKVENGRIYTIEGNSGNAVARNDYAASDPCITGFINTGKQNGFNYGDAAPAAAAGECEEASEAQAGESAASVTDPRVAEFEEKVDRMLEEWGSMKGWNEDDPVQGAMINEIIGRTGLNCADDKNGAWCCAFYTSMTDKYGVYDTSDSSWATLVSCGRLMQKAQAEGTLRSSQAHPMNGQTPYTPQAGDAVFFSWDGKAWDGGTEENHVGVVTKVENGKVYTLEGNADDHVDAREYDINDPRITGYIDVRAQNGIESSNEAQAAAGAESSGVAAGSGVENVADAPATEHEENVRRMLEEWGSMEGWSEDDPAQGAMINEIIKRTGLNCADDKNGAWCCAFYTSMAEKYGVYDTSDSSWATLVSCGRLMQKAQAEGTLRSSQAHPMNGQTPYTPQAGDAIFISWDGQAWDGGTEESHVGVVTKVENGKVYTLEGNADDHVRAREYDIDDPRITGYIDTAAQP